MLLLMSIALGAAFASLTEAIRKCDIWIWLLGFLKKEKQVDLALTICRVIGFLFALSVFLIAVYVFALGIYGRYSGNLQWWSVRALYFAALPTSSAAIIGFVIGAMLFWLRETLNRRYREILVLLRARSRGAGPTRRRGAGEAGAGQDGAAKSPYPWLTGIVGIAAVTLVAVITLVIFFPDVLVRVESIKVGGVEARFATSASYSVRIGRQAETSQSELNNILNKWSGVKKLFETRIAEVRQVFLDRGKITPEQFKQRAEADKQVLNFLTALAVPLAEVMACYSREFPIVQRTFVQSKAAPLANDWAGFAILVLEAGDKASDPQHAARLEQEWRERFEALKSALYDFITIVDLDLYLRRSRCGLTSTANPYGRDKSSQSDPAKRRNWEYFLNKAHIDLVTGIEKDLPAIFSNGYVIAFIADMIVFAHTPDHAIAFMNSVGPNIDQTEAAITGRFNFYTGRANARYRSEHWNFSDWIGDVKKARELAETIAKTIAGSDKTVCPSPAHSLARYYCWLAARTLNDLIYGHVRDWLEGRRISPQELYDLENWAKELHEWLRAQSHTALLNDGDTGAIGTMANSYDTLALYELMVGATKSELTKDRCGRGWALLNRSKSVWDTLQKSIGDDAYRGVINTFRAHEKLFVHACLS